MNSNSYTNNEGIDILKIFQFLWLYKKYILIVIIISFSIGLLYYKFAEPLYVSNAIIAPKESKSSGGGSSSMLSQLSGIGGMFAANLGIGNVNLERLEVIATSLELSEKIVKKHSLKKSLFPELWDKKNNKWKVKDLEIPSLQKAAKKYNKMLDYKEKNGIINVTFITNNPHKSFKYLNLFLDNLNEKLKHDVIEDANTNITYLRDKIEQSADPVIREKLQAMVSYELERSMLVSSKSIDILDKPYVKKNPVKPKLFIILIISLFAGFFMSIFFVVTFHWINLNKEQLKKILR